MATDGRSGPETLCDQPRARRVVMVDDHVATLRLLSKGFAEQGYDCWAADDVESALSTVEYVQPDLLTLELRVAGANTVPLIRSLAVAHPDMRIVVVTCYSDLDQVWEALSAGAYHCVAKPALPCEILEALGSPADETAAPSEDNTLNAASWLYIDFLWDELDSVSAAAATLGIHRRSFQRRAQRMRARAGPG